jgi:hypothetical protein
VIARWQLLGGDCRAVLATLEPDSVDACVTDPPYELGFMGKKWDSSGVAFDSETWRAVYRVLKPGAHLLAFGGTRTIHRIAVAIEDAGFDIRDQLSWLYGSGFPKSLDVSKAIDAAAGATRPIGGKTSTSCPSFPQPCPGHPSANGSLGGGVMRHAVPTAPATDSAKQWAGWGTALKPSAEKIVLARKPDDEQEGITSCLLALRASIAGARSSSSRNEFAEAFASALTSAGPLAAMSAGLSAATDTSRSASAIDSSLSTVSSWLDTWAALSGHASTSITATGSSQTIDSQTLSFCLSRIMRASTTSVPASELSWLVSNVARQFLAFRLASETTRERIAIANAIERERIDATRGIDDSPIVLARKPLVGTVAANVLAHGTGGINVDACRIAATDKTPAPVGQYTRPSIGTVGHTGIRDGFSDHLGRWPANVLLDAEAAAMLDEQSGVRKSTGGIAAPQYDRPLRMGRTSGDGANAGGLGDTGGASRFFYVAKSSRAERDAGLGHMPPRTGGDATDRKDGSDGLNSPRAGAGRRGGARNTHPTVKPIDLMRYLVRLVTPPGGLVLDPFAGSGTTGIATLREGMRFIGVDLEPEYARLAIARIEEDAPLFNRRRGE